MKNRYIFGKWESNNLPLTPEKTIEICEIAQKRAQAFRNYPLDRVLSLFGRMSEKWSNPDYHLRKLANKLLPQETGFSREMIELGLKELCWTLNPELLRKKIDTEFKKIPRDAGYHYDHWTKTAFKWQPLGVFLHVLSGNVFLVAAGSLVEGLVTGNVNIFKVSSSERIFLPLLIKSMNELDNDGIVSGSIAMIDYSSEQTDVITEFKKRVDGIVVWGGEEAVKAYRTGLPARTRFIVFGPKLSLALVTSAGLKESGIKEVSFALAREISIWDQKACTAPQVCFVEGLKNAENLANCLADALCEVSKTLCPGKVDIDTAVEIRKIRTIFEIAQAKKQGLLIEAPKELDWTVILDKKISIEPSPLHRTIKIIPFQDLNEVEKQIESLRGYIQTIGTAASFKEHDRICRGLEKSGVLRITSLGNMASGEIDDPHDGGYDLPQYMNLVFTRLPYSSAISPIDALPDEERKSLIDSRLRLLIEKARKAPFYSRRLKGIQINSVDDLKEIPVLTRHEMEKNMPPAGFGLWTGGREGLRFGAKDAPACVGAGMERKAPQGGYVSRSGGSTGKPKFSIYDGHDWEQMINNAVHVLLACGLEPGDRLANCFMAGDLYGSFVSFDHINSRIGATTFAFAADAKPETFVRIWKDFSINAIEGVPTTIMPMLRKAKEIEPELAIEKVIFAGSPMSPSDRQWLESGLCAKRISSVIGANDGGQIAYQCEHLSGNLHHTVDDFNYIEILDKDGRALPDRKPGRIVITSLLKYAFPLIRYDISDIGRIIPGKCRCGRTSRMLEFLGRAQDEIVVGCMNAKYQDFRQALMNLPLSEMQIVAKNSDKGEILALRMETSDYRSDELKSRINKTLLKKMPVIKDRLESHKLHKLEIELSSPGSLERNPRSGKVKNIVDERK